MVNIKLPVWIFLFISLISMTACADKEEKGSLSGKTKNWEATVEYRSRENASEEKLTIRYIGGEAALVGQIQYKLKNGQKVLSEEKTFLDGDGKIIMSSVLKDSSPLAEADQITLEILWNHQKDVVLLNQ